MTLFQNDYDLEMTWLEMFYGHYIFNQYYK